MPLSPNFPQCLTLLWGVSVSPLGKLVQLTPLQELVLMPSEVSRHLLI